LHQYVPNMWSMADLSKDMHFVQWQDLDDLRHLINFWMGPKTDIDSDMDGMRREIIKTGKELAREHHTYTARVAQLFDELLPMIEGMNA